jgi:hypothetical protein
MGFLNFDEYASIVSESSLITNKLIDDFDTWLYGSINEGVVNLAQLESVRNKNADGMTDAQALERAKNIIKISKLKILNLFPWYGPYLDIMAIIPLFGIGGNYNDPNWDGVGTMATDGMNIYYDPRFVIRETEKGKKGDYKINVDPKDDKKGTFASISSGRVWYNDYVTFVLAHEIMHNALLHFQRTQENISSEWLTRNEILNLWNIAQDYEINRILSDSTILPLPSMGIHYTRPISLVPEGDEEFFKTETAERIFWRLFRNFEEMRKKAGQKPQQTASIDLPINVGMIIKDRDSNKYGKVTKVNSDGTVEWDEITKQEAMNIVKNKKTI